VEAGSVYPKIYGQENCIKEINASVSGRGREAKKKKFHSQYLSQIKSGNKISLPVIKTLFC
jgi:hypothetical protein